MIEAIFTQLEDSFLPEVFTKETSFYFSIGPFKKTLYLGPKSCRIEDGKIIEQADCVCKTSPEFFQRIWNEGYRPGLKDFLSGAIRSNNPDTLKTFLAAFGKAA